MPQAQVLWTANRSASPSNHGHGQIRTDGTIGTTADQIVVTTTGGSVTTGSASGGLSLSSGVLQSNPSYNTTATVSVTGTSNALNIGSSSIVLLDPGAAARTINGITGTTNGIAVLLINVGANSITLTHNSGSATPDKRLQTPNGQNYTLGANCSARIVYEDGLGCWRLLGVSEVDTRLATDGSKGDITVSSNGQVWTIASGVVTNADLANVATQTFKGRASSGTGSPEDMNVTQATALLNTFTNSLKGLAPASSGGTTNYLRADGTWAQPPGTGGSASVGGDLYLWSVFR